MTLFAPTAPSVNVTAPLSIPPVTLPLHAPITTPIESPVRDIFNLQPMQLWAFLENSDFQRLKNGKIERYDEVAMIRHDEYLDHDYDLMVSIGCKGIRDAARWYLTHPAPGVYDWTWLDQVVDSADQHGLALYLDLWHYGYPDWLDILSPDAPAHFAEFAAQIALRYPSLQYYCVCNEPSLLVELGGRQGIWSPFLKQTDSTKFRQQVCRLIIAASEAILAIKPDAILVLPDPWHASLKAPEEEQAAVIDTVLGRRDPELGGRSELVTIIGLNHYRDTTIPPFHRLLINAGKRWADKELWITETSGPPVGWQQAEWFWWMLAETRLANIAGVRTPVFTWAPAISMYDWIDETEQLHNGIWILDEENDYARLPNGRMLDAVELARKYGYLV